MTPSIELYLIKALFSYSLYSSYRDYIQEEYIKNNNKELYKILQVIHIYHKDFPSKDISSVEEFEAFYFVHYPTLNSKERDNVSSILSRLAGINVEHSVAEQIFVKHAEASRATELAVLSLEVAEGKRSFDELASAGAKLNELRCHLKQPDPFVTDSLLEIEKELFHEQGLNWRLGSLNRSFGPLRRGNFGFIFARPESGKTTFLSSEVSNFVSQTDGNILWFNNEQPGNEVKRRIIQSYFGVLSHVVTERKETLGKIFVEKTSGRIKVTDDEWDNSRSAVERMCRDHNPSLIIFDQIDKIRGFSNDRYDLEMKEIYQWARELARQYGPVIGVCQAGSTGDNKQYLDMNDVDSSKTSKQGEADWILGIGKSHQPGLEHVRFFNISKNKLLGGPQTEESMRHGKWQVKFKPEIGRYEDIIS